MNLDNRQHKTLLIGLGVMLCAVLFPPWQQSAFTSERTLNDFLGYAFLFSPPSAASRIFQVSIKMDVLIAQLAIVAFTVLGLTIGLANHKGIVSKLYNRLKIPPPTPVDEEELHILQEARRELGSAELLERVRFPVSIELRCERCGSEIMWLRKENNGDFVVSCNRPQCDNRKTLIQRQI